MKLIELLNHIQPIFKVFLITALALAAHFGVKAIRQLSKYLVTIKVGNEVISEATLIRKYPKAATVLTLLISAVTFTIYFFAVGLILREFSISLTTYFASATVIGLAVGFGLQGFVQDVVIGLTLIFTDALNIGDVVKLSDEIGKIDYIGLRFTTLINLHGQRILIPNRNIGIIGQFRDGCIRAYVDIQMPQGTNEEEICQTIHQIARGMYYQHKSLILVMPENFGVNDVKDGQWRYLRIKFKLWPGQTKIIEETFKERVTQLLQKSSAEYSAWMITMSYKVE